MKQVFANCKLFDGNEGSKIRENVNIYVNDRIITAISEDKNFDGYKVIDLKGQYVTPGLINLHAHLFGSGRPSKVLGGGGLQQLVIKFTTTKLGAKILDMIVGSAVKAQLYSGVTTLRTSGDFHYSDVRIRDKVNAGAKVGPRLIVCGPAITVPGGHGDGTFALTGSTDSELRQLVRLNYNNKVDYIKICVTGGVMDAKKEGEPGELKMSVEQTTSVCEEAHKLGLKVASHTESPEGVRVDALAKVDTIEHGSLFDDEVMALIKGYNGALVPTISPALFLSKLPSELTKLNKMCVFNSKVVADNMILGGKKGLANDIMVGLGTDASCPFVTQYDTYREVGYFAKYMEVSNAKALSVATIGNAKILGLDKVTGTIEVGKSADMIVMPTNPLDELKALGNLTMVVAQGKVIDKPLVKKNQGLTDIIDSIS